MKVNQISNCFFQSIKYSFFAAGAGWLLPQATGCAVAKPDPLPVIKKLPDSFPLVQQPQQPDSGHLLFRQLFPDSSLIALIDTAVKYNADVNIAYQRMMIAQARLTNSKRALLPSVDAKIGAAADKYGDYTLNGVGNFDTNLSPNISKDQEIPVRPTTDLFVGLQSSWEIDLWGKLADLKKAAQAALLAEEQGRRMVITNLVSLITQSYFNLQSLDKELEIVKRNIALQEEAVEIVKAQKAGGRANELAVQQFESQLLNTRAIEYNILQERVRIENELNTLVGNYSQPLVRSAALPETFPVLGSHLPASLLFRRPDIRQAELHLQVAQGNINATRKAFLPSLSIHPYVALNAFTPALLFNAGSVAWGAAGGLTAPLLNRRELKMQLAIANASNKEAAWRYQQTLLDAYNEASTNLAAMYNTKAAFTLKAQEVETLRAATQTARDLYLTGYATYLEVITAQKNALEAELQSIRQKAEIFRSAIRLYHSLGGGWDV